MTYIDFLRTYMHTDSNQLRLKLIKKEMPEDERALIENYILGIECNKKFRGKFKYLLNEFAEFRFPSVLAGEQASHESVSAYHADLVKSLPEYPFSQFIDMTSGLGMDFMAISKVAGGNDSSFSSVALDIDALKSQTLAENLQLLGVQNAKAVNFDSLLYIKELIGKEDTRKTLIFVDPARRDNGNGRLYDPKDCLPDIPGNLDSIMKVAEVLLIKNSPMLEPLELLRQFPGVRRIHIVSYKNECKEVLLEIPKSNETFEGVRIVNITDDAEHSHYINEVLDIPASEWTNQEGIAYISDHELRNILDKGERLYLYEPNSGLMKTCCWGYLVKKYPELKKAAPHTHLFFSPTLIPDFPGRVLEIEKVLEKVDKKKLKGDKLNVVCRNFPLTPDKIIKDYKLKATPTAEKFLYALKIFDQKNSSLNPIMLIAKKVDLTCK